MFAVVALGLPCARAQGTAELQQGVALFNQRNYAAASGLFTRSAQQGNVRATYYLALCHQQLKQDDKAIELFKHIKANFPDSDEAKLSSTFLDKMPETPAVTQAPKTETDKKKAQYEAQYAALWKTLPDTARIPFQMKQGHMWVQAKVNGKYCDIVFDTGASACVISLADFPDMFSAAELAAAPKVPVARPHGRVTMSVVTGEVSVDRITRKLSILVTNEPGVTVIGQNFFKEYQYEIDGFYVRMKKAPYESPIAKLDGGGERTSVSVAKTAKTQDKYSIPFERSGNCMVVQVVVNGRKVPTVFDTGCAPDGIVMPMSFVQQLGIQRNSDGLYAETVEIGPILRKYAKVHFANGLDTLLIGPKFFGDRPYTVDPTNNLIRFQY